MTRSNTILLLSLGLAAAAMAPRALAADLQRHTTWHGAQAAAQKSGKFILAYIYQPGHTACVAMEEKTLRDDRVISALAGYEFLALNGDARQSRDFCERYGVGTRWNPQETPEDARTAFAAIPGYLFLDYNGREYYRTYGFYAPDVFLQLLDQAAHLIQYQCELAQRPQDPLLHARLGRLYLELERPGLAQPLLETAIKLDANNDAGARAEAELDLIILSIPDDPVMAFRNLVAYQFNRPETKRTLEIHYYMAVAQLAAGKQAQAEKILLDFASIPPFLPDDHTLQGVSYGYMVQKGNQQVGFYLVDDLDQVKQAMRKDNQDPAGCQFIRRAINPDYRNPWTEKADLLLGQLRELQGQQNKP